MVRTKRYKLVRYESESIVRLFDLGIDARERCDVADKLNLRMVRASLEHRLTAHHATFSVPAKSGIRPRRSRSATRWQAAAGIADRKEAALTGRA
jgi:hypothetical protein